MEKVGNIQPYFQKKLNLLYKRREINSLSYITIKFLLDFNRSDCIINHDKVLSNHQVKFLKNIVRQLMKNIPIQYILKETIFYNLKFYVNKNTLIPRPETEELVKWILKHDFKSVLDIGTGSGCIAIAIAKNSNAKITATDISLKALSVAKKNMMINKVNIKYIHHDIFQSQLKGKFNIIVSNPPYVLENEKQHIKPNVLDHEPHTAIFVPNDNPLLFYKKIINLATKKLLKGGMLFFEINEKYGLAIKQILSLKGFVNIELKKDINEKERMIKAILK